MDLPFIHTFQKRNSTKRRVKWQKQQKQYNFAVSTTGFDVTADGFAVFTQRVAVTDYVADYANYD